MSTLSAKPTRSLAKRKKLPASRRKTAQSAFERFKPYIGVISGPADLSTNPKYMEGFGESRRP